MQIYNQQILNAVADKFGYSVDYCRKALRGDRTGIMPDKIKAEYSAGIDRLNNTVETFKSE